MRVHPDSRAVTGALRERPMNSVDEKNRELRLRRAAARQGLALRKCRTRTVESYDYGTYHLVDAATNFLAVWGLQSGYGLSLDDVERALSE